MFCSGCQKYDIPRMFRCMYIMLSPMTKSACIDLIGETDNVVTICNHLKLSVIIRPHVIRLTQGRYKPVVSRKQTWDNDFVI